MARDIAKPGINWSHVAPEFVSLARDMDGSAWLYRQQPRAGMIGWETGALGMSAGDFVSALGLASYTPGNCLWDESLVMRPGHEGETA